ncbi:MAG TPA: cupin domain-containing protein [Aestuariivirgaceae bacterium]|nr:cupin domain-containing protein [Aestuariivirgaceae bacterium]
MTAIYRINDVAARFGISKSSLRQWEQYGLVAPHRAPSGYRRYSDSDIARVADIIRMRHIEGLNLAAIAAVLQRANGDGNGSESARPVPGYTNPARQLGKRLRALRQRRGLSLTRAAAQAGISRSALSLVERTSQGVGPATMRNLARVYGLTLTELMAPLGGAGAPVVRAGQARVLPTLGPGLAVMQLSSIPNALMSCQITVVQPGAGSQGSYCHEGEEFIYVLEGTFSISIDGEEPYELAEGDTIYFESRRHHSWWNPGAAETRILWVNTPPSY